MLTRPRSTSGANHVTAEAETSDSPLVILSQRGPLSFSVDDQGNLSHKPASGGLANALGSLALRHPVTWIAVAMNTADRIAALKGESIGFGAANLQLVLMPTEVQQQHYSMVANPVLWFIQHGMAGRLNGTLEESALLRAWESGYRSANKLLAQEALQQVQSPRPLILVQDYHYYLVPQLIREARPGARIAHFVHIPWPEPEAWAALPHSIVVELLGGLLGADLVGLQSARDAEQFRETCLEYLPDVDVDEDGRVLGGDGRSTFVHHYPITTDVAALQELVASPEAAAYRREMCGARRLGMQTILRVDRLDPSKNIPVGFKAFGRLLADVPYLRGRIRFLAHLVPSRTELEEYQQELEAARAAADEVNARFGTPDWRPIEIVYEENRMRALVEMEDYDVLLVNSVADGMNLVAKEGAVLNRRDGQIVLSTRAGAWEELRRGAFGIDPADIFGTAEAMYRALTLPPVERTRRAAALRNAVNASSLDRWLSDQMRDLVPVASEARLF